eukprot:2505975-Amphidinium_carterae.2
MQGAALHLTHTSRRPRAGLARASRRPRARLARLARTWRGPRADFERAYPWKLPPILHFPKTSVPVPSF